MNAKEPKDPNEMKMKGLIDWNELTEISFQTSRVALDIVKNKENLSSSDEIELANQIVTRISGNIQVIQQAVELHLKQYPESYAYIHPYLKSIIPSEEELQEEEDEDEEIFISFLVKNR
jgi:hypothetical protein